jgi:hypothetical protein
VAIKSAVASVVTPSISERASYFWESLNIFNVRVNHERKQQQADDKQLPLLVSCMEYSPTLLMEATCSSETLGFFRTTWRY